jgi:hypothetical protein
MNRQLLIVGALFALPFLGARPVLASVDAAVPTPAPSPTAPAFPFVPSMHLSVASMANTIAIEDAVVIRTDDWSYTRSPHDAGKIDPLDGLPFSKTVSEEIGTAIATDMLLRNPHRVKLLQYVTIGFPVFERSIIGAGFHYWKVFKV